VDSIVKLEAASVREFFILELTTSIETILILSVWYLERFVGYPGHGQSERIIPTNPFLSRTPFCGRSDFGLFKELLIPSKIIVFSFQLNFSIEFN
jgi:hypothetical protein